MKFSDQHTIVFSSVVEKEMMEGIKKEKTLSFWSFKSYRLLVTLIFGLMATANGMLRNTLSFAMVCMVTSNKTEDSTQENSSCSSAASQINEEYQGTFDWNTFEQGMLFSALQIGGVLTALPAGWIADRYDPKTLVSVSIFMTTLCSVLSPVTANMGGFIAFVILRLIMGLFGQAVIYSGISSISARWVPPTERSTVIALYTAGNQFCSVIGSPLNAYLCHSANWESIFYVNATFGIAAFVLWVIFVSNRPENNRFISSTEREYIESSLANQSLGKRKDVTKKIPWLKMLTSTAVVMTLLCNFAAGLMGSTLNTYIPTYFKDALYVNLLSNGLYSSLPFIVQCISKVLFAMIADKMKQKTNISPTWICKLFNSISHFGAAAFLIACSFTNCSTVGLAVTFLCLAQACLAGNSSGFLTSAVSVAPPFSGIIQSYGRLAGQVGSVVSPYVVSLFAPDQHSIREWQNVFFIMAAAMFLTGVLFLIFGSASIQTWAITTPTTFQEKTIDTIISIEYSKYPAQKNYFSDSTNVDKSHMKF